MICHGKKYHIYPIQIDFLPEFDISRITHLGLSSALAIEESVNDMLQAGKKVFIVHCQGQPIERLRNLGLLASIPEKHVVSNRKKAMEFAIYGSDQSGDLKKTASSHDGTTLATC